MDNTIRGRFTDGKSSAEFIRLLIEHDIPTQRVWMLVDLEPDEYIIDVDDNTAAISVHQMAGYLKMIEAAGQEPMHFLAMYGITGTSRVDGWFEQAQKIMALDGVRNIVVVEGLDMPDIMWIAHGEILYVGSECVRELREMAVKISTLPDGAKARRKDSKEPPSAHASIFKPAMGQA